MFSRCATRCLSKRPAATSCSSSFLRAHVLKGHPHPGGKRKKKADHSGVRILPSLTSMALRCQRAVRSGPRLQMRLRASLASFDYNPSKCSGAADTISSFRAKSYTTAKDRSDDPITVTADSTKENRRVRSTPKGKRSGKEC